MCSVHVVRRDHIQNWSCESLPNYTEETEHVIWVKSDILENLSDRHAISVKSDTHRNTFTNTHPIIIHSDNIPPTEPITSQYRGHYTTYCIEPLNPLTITDEPFSTDPVSMVTHTITPKPALKDSYITTHHVTSSSLIIIIIIKLNRASSHLLPKVLNEVKSWG